MIYLDHNATTPLDERVLEAMLPYLGACYGNASALYRWGRLSRAAVDAAREQVAALVGAHPSQVIFTSGGTEANNLAIKGLGFGRPPGLGVAGATEHPSVTEPLHWLAGRGWRVASIPVDRNGRPEPAFLDDLGVGSLDFGSLMLANNETGVIHEVAPIAMRIRELGGFFHVDAVQAAGRIPIDFPATGAHALSLSAHKIHGPKGIGALVADRALPLEPLLHGGGQEQGLRAGTENVAGIVGFGMAAELARIELEPRRSRSMNLRRELESGLKCLPGVTIFGEEAERLPNTVHFGVAGCDGENLVMNLDRKGFAVSSGSACAGGREPSPVLTAMGVDPETARSAIRVSLGKDNTGTEIVRFLESLKELLPATYD